MRLTLEEFATYAEEFAREHDEAGTLSYRHLQRLASGRGANGGPLRSVRPPTARLLERILDTSIDELLSPPSEVHELRQAPDGAAASPAAPGPKPDERIPSCRAHQLTTPLAWLDERIGWEREATRKAVGARAATLETGQLLDRHTRRAHIPRSVVAEALADYYGASAVDQLYTTRFSGNEITTSIVTRPGWLDLACPLTSERDRLSLIRSDRNPVPCTFSSDHAVDRLAEATVSDVQLANAPLYRLVDVDTGAHGITGTVAQVPFTEYALTLDLLEAELIDSLADGRPAGPGELPLRDEYLPDLTTVLDLPRRLCVGGVPALCAIARPTGPRGDSDYALLVQERSGSVLNSQHRLSVIPKGFHQPCTDPRGDARLGVTVQRQLEEELFGRHELEIATGEQRAALPLHPSRLSEPMRWLRASPERLRTECTGFGLNLLTGNYEFAGLVAIEDEQFWERFGGDVEANWEAAGLRLYSTRDAELLDELVSDPAWGDEGLFALLQGLLRLGELAPHRVALPDRAARSG